MAAGERLICSAADLIEGGDGVRFPISENGDPAFVIRYGTRIFGYVNRCAHQSVELDWMPNKFFDDSGLYLVCATHGALYEPESGRCVMGPCKGATLEKLRVIERDGRVYWIPASVCDPTRIAVHK